MNNEETNTDSKKSLTSKLLSCFPISLSKCSILTYGSYIALVVVVFAATTWVIHSVYPSIGSWFLNQNLDTATNLPASQSSDRYNAVNLTSSLVIASITIVYVVFTAFLFHTTSKNTEQTAKSQKIAYLERRLEKFYMPMQSSLKRFDCDKMVKLIESSDMNVNQHLPRMYYKMNAVWWDFKSDYTKVVPFTYLASNKVQDVLNDLTNIFYSNKVFVKQYPQHVVFDNIISGEIESSLTQENSAEFIKNKNNISAYYQELSSEIDNDIRLLRAELSKLVNL
jgi:hypothetical protein